MGFTIDGIGGPLAFGAAVGRFHCGTMDGPAAIGIRGCILMGAIVGLCCTSMSPISTTMSGARDGIVLVVSVGWHRVGVGGVLLPVESRTSEATSALLMVT